MQPLIELKHVDFSVNADRKIINDLSLTVFPGDFIVVLGGNGSGKSTLFKLINQTYQKTGGDIVFKNQPINQIDSKIIRREIITITQFISDSIFVDLTIEENATLIEGKKIQSQLLSDYLAQFNPKFPKALKTRVKNLSGGEQQILAFALYLRHQPDLLLLDEHTSALDPKKSDAVMTLTQRYILEKKITCLMTTHEMQHALQYGNRLIALRDGKLDFEANAAEKSQLELIDLLKQCY